MMVDIQARQNKPVVQFQPLRPKRVEKLVKKFENCQTPPSIPPPIAFKAPPTPPPVDHLENNRGMSFTFGISQNVLQF